MTEQEGAVGEQVDEIGVSGRVGRRVVIPKPVASKLKLGAKNYWIWRSEKQKIDTPCVMASMRTVLINHSQLPINLVYNVKI